MSELGIPFDPHEGEPATLIPGPAPTPPVVDPDPEPEGTPAHTPSPQEPDTGAVPGFDKLALILLVIGLILAGLAFNDFLNWLLRNTVGRITGGKRTPQLSGEATTQALGSYLGKFAQGFDPEVGTAFTQIATTTGAMSRGYVALANRILKLAVVVGGLAAQGAGQQQAQNALRHTVQTQGANQHATQQQVEHNRKQQQQQQTATDVQVHALTEHITTVIEPELARLRQRIPPLEKGQATTTARITDHDRQLGLDAMVGTVAMSMARLGTSWTRCDTNRDIGESLCSNGGQGLKNLLKGLIPFVDIAALCGLIAVIARTGKSPVVTATLGAFSEGVEGLLSCTGATIAEPLPIAKPVLPPLTAWASLTPANV